MPTKKLISKTLYWIVILSMILSNILPATYISAQEVEGENINLGEKQLTETQKDEFAFFNFSGEGKGLNNFKNTGFEVTTPKGKAITTEDIKIQKLPYKKIKQKQAVKPVEEKQISIEKKETGSTLTQNKAYFDHLISQLSLSQPKSLDEVKNRGWKEISYGKIKPIEDLVKAVPNELLSSTEKTTTNMYDPGEREELKQKRSLPTLSLQSEYLIFFAKQNSANPATQNLKISNRGEGTLGIYD